jgi:regulator of sirC expression with transglutaminase-like and TPR domain
VFVDPFDGRYLDEAGCEARFHALHGDDARFSARYLAPVGPRQILGRMLANLRGAYLRLHDFESASWTMRLRLTIPGVPASEHLDLARVLARAGRFREAAETLEARAERDPEGAAALLSEARRWRGRLN